MTKSLLATVEEHWLVPANVSPRARTWVAAYDWLTLPFRVRGETRRYAWVQDGRRLTAIAVGSRKRTTQFCARLIGPATEVSADGHRTVWTATPLDPVDADLVVAEVHRWAAPRFQEAGWIVVPNSVRWQGEVAGLPPSPPSKSLRDDLRKLRQHRFTLERGAGSAADWDEFYGTMVLPHVRQRFGDAAWVPSPSFVRRLQRRANLYFIRRGDRRVGGFCTVPGGDRLWFPLMAPLAGDESLRREGVLAAAYGFVVEVAKSESYQRLDAGSTSAFVRDGIAAYKRKWGFQPVRNPMSPLLAVKLGNDPAIAEAFARQPVLIHTDTGLAEFAGRTP